VFCLVFREVRTCVFADVAVDSLKVKHSVYLSGRVGYQRLCSRLCSLHGQLP